MSTGLWERRIKGERGGETVASERWVALTNIELEKGGAGEGGAVELQFACEGTAERCADVENCRNFRGFGFI